MTRTTLTILVMLLCILKAAAQTDPTLAGMIVLYTDKAEKQLKSQEKVMLMQTTGRGKRLAEVYYIDPNYVLWLAHKFEARNPRDKKLAVLAKAFATVHYETVIRKHHLPAGSRFIGQPGERLTDLHLEVLGTRLQLDAYKTTGYYVDQSVLAADADGNRYTFIIKAAASSMSPEMLSCYTKKINPHESLYIKSAKVLSHYESKGIKYTRIGYLRFK